MIRTRQGASRSHEGQPLCGVSLSDAARCRSASQAARCGAGRYVDDRRPSRFCRVGRSRSWNRCSAKLRRVERARVARALRWRCAYLPKKFRTRSRRGGDCRQPRAPPPPPPPPDTRSALRRRERSKSLLPRFLRHALWGQNRAHSQRRDISDVVGIVVEEKHVGKSDALADGAMGR